jgi:uncharacterized protein YeaO (DUF488 family)
MPIELKRAYDPPARSDGRRVLVDRVWPRGIAKDELEIDAWLKRPGAEHRAAEVVRARCHEMAGVQAALLR